MSAVVIDPSQPFSADMPGASAPGGPAPEGFTVSPTGRLVDPSATPDQKTYAIFLHLSILSWFAIGPLSFLVPLVMWLIKKDQSAFLDDHGRESLNFHISITLYALIGGLLAIACVGWPLVLATFVLGVIGAVQGSTAANRGEIYRYPACIRLV